MHEPWQKKYEWRITWPGEGHEDWCAYDEEIRIGRIQRDMTTSGQQTRFRWNGLCVRMPGAKRTPQPVQGWKEEHWEAAKAVEDWYDRLRELNELPPRGE